MYFKISVVSDKLWPWDIKIGLNNILLYLHLLTGDDHYKLSAYCQILILQFVLNTYVKYKLKYQDLTVRLKLIVVMCYVQTKVSGSDSKFKAYSGHVLSTN